MSTAIEEFLNQPLLDDDQIGLLREALEPAELREMYVELPQSARNAVEQIEHAIETAADLDQVQRAAHVLKGVASSFGVLRLATLAQALELQTSSIEEARAYLPALTEVLEQTLGAVSGIFEAGAVVREVQT